jgi:hypothetical protein
MLPFSFLLLFFPSKKNTHEIYWGYINVASATFSIPRYYIGTHIFPEVLLNDISGPDGDSLLLSLKLAVDVLVSSPGTVF